VDRFYPERANDVIRDVRSLNANLHWRPSGFENVRFGVEYLYGQRDFGKLLRSFFVPIAIKLQ
jgi:hypothetical protein